MELRPYQVECLETIEARGAGKWLVQMATGLGKTVVFSHLPRPGRTLVLAHREELLAQAASHFDCLVGLEAAGNAAGDLAPVIVASVQTLVHRLGSYDPNDFHTIIVDEAHHAAAKTYRKILNYFAPVQLLGFTATPTRADGLGMEDIFNEIIYEYPLIKGIRDGWLAPIECRRARIGWDLSDVAFRMNDLAIGELSRAVNIEGASKAIAQAVELMAPKPALIFAVDIEHAHAIAAEIPGAIALDGTSKNRAQVVKDFRAGKIDVLVNCQLFTEGTDLPNVVSVVIARPTGSAVLYQQMVGRGTRLHPGKTGMVLVDCIGCNGRHNLCTASTLIGLDPSQVPEKFKDDLVGDLLADLPELVRKSLDTPETWVKAWEVVDIWAKGRGYQMHQVSYFRTPAGALRCTFPLMEDGKKQRGMKWIEVAGEDLVGMTQVRTSGRWASGKMPMQKAFDLVFKVLEERFKDSRNLWDLRLIKRWGKAPATDRQKALLAQFGHDLGPINKMQAGAVLDRLMCR